MELNVIQVRAHIGRKALRRGEVQRLGRLLASRDHQNSVEVGL